MNLARPRSYAAPVLTDYATITAERALGVIEDAIAEGDALVAGVVDLQDDRTYGNTIAPLDRCFVVLGDAYGVGGFMARVHPDESVRAAGAQAEEKQQKWLADLDFNRGLYEAVRAYAATEDASSLVGERRRNLEFWLRDFRRAGHELSEAERDEVQQLRSRLIEI